MSLFKRMLPEPLTEPLSTEEQLLQRQNEGLDWVYDRLDIPQQHRCYVAPKQVSWPIYDECEVSGANVEPLGGPFTYA